MKLALYIAKRYLFAKKSHNIINIISAISAVGIAIGTAALIIILSIFNGFSDYIKKSLASIEADVIIRAKNDKSFVIDSVITNKLEKYKSVSTLSYVIEENVYLTYNNKSCIARVKGVDTTFEKSMTISKDIRSGEAKLHHGSLSLALVSSQLAQELEINPYMQEKLQLAYPNRKSRFAFFNKNSLVNTYQIFPNGIFELNSKEKNKLLIVPIEVMQDLLSYKDELSYIELRFSRDIKDKASIIKELKASIDSKYLVQDRYEQNPNLYKMMRYEKLSIYMILIFIIIIISLNIFGSISMLIIEKKDDIKILRSMGATSYLIKQIFIFEAWLVSIYGLIIGLIIGISLVLMQEKFAFIKMPISHSNEAYPIILNFSDISITIATIAIIGYIISLLSLTHKELR